MAAPKGNQFWKARSKHGRNPIFSSPDDLWNACCDYFEWTEDHPLQEEKLFAYQGEVTRATVHKMRAMTIEGLCLFLDITHETWTNYKKREDFFGVTTRAEAVIRVQKFQGAAADLLNPNIIARDLGLKDRTENEYTDKSQRLRREDVDNVKLDGLTEEERELLTTLLSKIEGLARTNS